MIKKLSLNQIENLTCILILENFCDDVQFFYKERDPLSKLYYELWQKYGRNFSFHPFLNRKKEHFLANYILSKEFFKQLHPFQFINENDNLIQVGFHDQYILNGISHPFIMSSLIGQNGNIWMLDPDNTNIQFAKKYIKMNGIKNAHTIKTGVWKEKSIKKFSFFSDFSSSNVFSDILDKTKEQKEKTWGKKRIKEQSRTITSTVDSLDNIVQNSINDEIDFVNITVNSAEYDVLQGCKKLLKLNKEIKIAFPLENMNIEGLKMLADEEFYITVSNSPHRPWEKKPFYYACAIRTDKKKLKEKGFTKIKLKQFSSAKHVLGYQFKIDNS